MIHNRFPSEAAPEGLAGIAIRDNVLQEIIEGVIPVPVEGVKLSGGVSRAKSSISTGPKRELPDLIPDELRGRGKDYQDEIAKRREEAKDAAVRDADEQGLRLEYKAY